MDRFQFRRGDESFAPIYRSIYDPVKSNMYIFISSGEAVIIDPNISDEAAALLEENNVHRVIIGLTHEHHDHTSGLYWYQEHFDSTVICQKYCAECMDSKKYLRPMLLKFILGKEDKIGGTHKLEEFEKVFVPRQYRADVTYEEELFLNWDNHKLELIHIPGHSKGSSLIILDENFVFTGDSLLKDIPIITRFPGSIQSDYEQITLPILRKKLRNNMILLPGHGNPFIINDIIRGGEICVNFR